MKKTPIAIAVLTASMALAAGSAFAAGQSGSMSGGTPGSAQGSLGMSFSQLDSNADGMVNQDEAAQSPVLSDNWSVADANQDGSVDQSEFSAFESTVAESGMGTVAPPSGGLDMRFSELDTNMDGVINEQEAAQSPVLSQNWSTADANQDGVVDQSEFSAFEEQVGGSTMREGAGAGGAGVSFSELDANADGMISPDESALSPSLNQSWSNVDTNQDGMVDQSEFSAFEYQSGTAGGATGGSASFSALDTDGDNMISQDEAAADPNLSQQFSSADINQDGNLDQSEFSAFESQMGTTPSMPPSDGAMGQPGSGGMGGDTGGGTGGM